uniref:G_PROTEIN_RECEP_F1_2 domain-containing protein n=1 Tax=Steinernema glaseri TaxID=37863 RepID=A0A1I7ZXV5_9BILA
MPNMPYMAKIAAIANQRAYILWKGKENSSEIKRYNCTSSDLISLEKKIGILSSKDVPVVVACHHDTDVWRIHIMSCGVTIDVTVDPPKPTTWICGNWISRDPEKYNFVQLVHFAGGFHVATFLCATPSSYAAVGDYASIGSSLDNMCLQPPFTTSSWKAAMYIQYTTVGLSLLTIPLYVLVISILLVNLKRLKHNKAFFIFFLVNGFVDVISILANALGTSFPAWGLFLDFYLTQGTLIGKIHFVVTYWTRYSQGVHTLLIAFNRSTAVFFPLRYEKIWSRRWVQVCVAVQVLIGAPVGILIATTDYYWSLSCTAPNLWDHLPYVTRMQSEILVLVLTFRDNLFKNLVMGVSFSAEVIIFFVLVFNYSLIVFKMRQQRSNNTAMQSDSNGTHMSPSQREAKKQNRRQNFMLLRMAVVICVLELSYAVFAVLAVVQILNTDQFHFSNNLMTTIYSSMGPYLIIFFSKNTRIMIRTALSSNELLLTKVTPMNYTNSSRGSSVLPNAK